jgi:hypothetical protein
MTALADSGGKGGRSKRRRRAWLIGLAVVALGGGFAAGWFADEILDGDTTTTTTMTTAAPVAPEAASSDGALVWCNYGPHLDDVLAATETLERWVVFAAAREAAQAGNVPEWALAEGGGTIRSDALYGLEGSSGSALQTLRFAWTQALRTQYPEEYNRACVAAYEMGDRDIRWDADGNQVE